MSKISTKEFRQLLKFLRQHFKTERPIEIRRIKKKKDCATLYFNSRKYIIYVDDSLSREAMLDTIYHEFAHAVAIDRICGHNDYWGKVYSEIYTKSLEFGV